MATGSDFVEFANRHVGEKYIFGAFAPKNNPNWKGPWDCAEFASWVTFQQTGLLIGCIDNKEDPSRANAYSGAWARDSAFQRPLTIGQAKATAGAVLIRKPAPSGIGHVAISQGDGTTIEAHSSKTGVCNREVDGRRWDVAMLVPLIEYPSDISIAVFSPPDGLILRLTFPPMQGALVTTLQQALNERGLDPGSIDGVFGPHTEAAVRGFQLQVGLAPDGEAGSLTMKKLGIKA